MVLVPLRFFSFKISTARAFGVPPIADRVLRREKMTGDNVLFENWYLLGLNKQSRTLGTSKGYFKSFQQAPLPVPFM